VSTLQEDFIEVVSPKGKTKKFKNTSSHRERTECCVPSFCGTNHTLECSSFRFGRLTIQSDMELHQHPIHVCLKWCTVGYSIYVFNFVRHRNIEQYCESQDRHYITIREIETDLLSYVKSMDVEIEAPPKYEPSKILV
jgi:hypothetical protein